MVPTAISRVGLGGDGSGVERGQRVLIVIAQNQAHDEIKSDARA